MHVLWINEVAALTGGCERYIEQTVRLLRARGVKCSFLYGVQGWTEPRFTEVFDAAYPMVEVDEQIRWLQPDLIYIHRLSDRDALSMIEASGIPSVRFFHDHKLFCLREHKYTTLGHHTCTRTVGLNCYPCLGFVNKSSNWPGIRFSRVSTLLNEQAQNMNLSAFVVGSQYMAKHVAAHGFESTRIHTIPLFVEAPPSAPIIAREKDLVLFVGQLVRGKGLDILLEALSRMKAPVRLVIAGTGSQETMFRDHAMRLGMNDRITFLGQLPSGELESYYQRAACLAFPSLSPETFGLVGLEAMARGMPVVGTSVGGMSEWLVDGETGVSVPSGDAPALATALDRIIMNPEFATRLGDSARRRSLERFQAEHHVTRLLSLFQGLCGKTVDA